MGVPDDGGFVGRFAELYRIAYRVAYAPLGSRAEAEECAQEALARALVRWRSVEDHAEAWVARVSVNLALDRVRRRVRERRYMATAQGSPTGSADVVAERNDLVTALRALPRRQRDVIVLRFLADLSERDVADGLGCAVGTVKSATARGLERLRVLMRSDLATDGGG
jgi:RNA polymerase sigma factor (sigma-70 family)